MTNIVTVYKFSALLSAIAVIVSGCTFDPARLVVGFGERVARSIREETIIGRPRDARSKLLAFATKLPNKNDWVNDDRLKNVRAYLRDQTEQIVQYVNSFPVERLADPPATNRLPTVEVTILHRMKPDVVVVTNDKPEIRISVGYLLNLALATNVIEDPKPFMVGSFDHDDENALFGWFRNVAKRRLGQMLEEMEERQAVLEFQEAILFSLAHEVVHIWMDRPQETQKKRERRADAYGILLNLSVSEAVKRRAKLQAEFGHSLSVQFRDPLDITILAFNYGPEVALNVYRDYCFEGFCYQKGDDAHDTIGQRIDTASRRAKKIVERLIGGRSDSEISRDRFLRQLKDAVLGF